MCKLHYVSCKNGKLDGRSNGNQWGWGLANAQLSRFPTNHRDSFLKTMCCHISEWWSHLLAVTTLMYSNECSNESLMLESYVEHILRRNPHKASAAINTLTLKLHPVLWPWMKNDKLIEHELRLPELFWHTEMGWKGSLPGPLLSNYCKLTVCHFESNVEETPCSCSCMSHAMSVCACVWKWVCKSVPVRTPVLVSHWVQLQPCRCYRWSLSSPLRWTSVWTAAEDHMKKTVHNIHRIGK